MSVLMNLFHVLVFPGLLFCVVMGVLLSGLDRIWVARMQRRVGPPLLQPLYDFLKCCGKETIIPRHARKAAFLAAPVVGFVALVSISLFLPVAGQEAVFSGSSDLVVILYLLTLVSVCMIVGAACSGAPFAGVGLSREMVAMISYELPFVLVILAVSSVTFTVTGNVPQSFSLQAIVDFQAANGALITRLSMIPAAIAMLLVIPCEVGNHPFDVAEAETEICEGTLSEYSGAPLAIFRLTHMVKMYIMAALFCVMFLGGITTGIVLLDIAIFVLFCIVLTFITSSLPHAVCARFKVEQVFKFYWTVVAGLAVISLILVWLGL
ncbi:MAG: NADH-quinone oxidoreductase subunit H [Oscillospiraceae bacterium]|nr:NADH-quinone oxidoreductase subunit H [Oscillospiraceae bacterium]